MIRLSSLRAEEIPPELVWVQRHVQECRLCRLACEAAKEIDVPADVRLKQRYSRFVEVNETPVGVMALAAIALATMFLTFFPSTRKEPNHDGFP